MEPNSDLIDLLRALNDAGAEYLIVGEGLAFAVPGRVRATKDADIFVGSDADNAAKVLLALQTFGALPSRTSPSATSRYPKRSSSWDVPPTRYDIITTIDGVTFDARIAQSLRGHVRRHSRWYIGRDDLIANKEAAGRAPGLARHRLLRGKSGTSS